MKKKYIYCLIGKFDFESDIEVKKSALRTLKILLSRGIYEWLMWQSVIVFKVNSSGVAVKYRTYATERNCQL